ncbi:MAG TPA: hypothetical protein VLQ29_00630, partial [Candidatus Dormibacteraeota bacterium]|nr:hypothetical protein [Candidatus Dormibacteraeota bacterium]
GIMRPTEKLGVADCAADAQLRATSYRRFYSRITKAMNKSSLLITLSTFPPTMFPTCHILMYRVD